MPMKKKKKWIRSIIRVEALRTDVIRYTSPGCAWKIERTAWMRRGWIISEAGQPICTNADDGWRMSEWTLKVSAQTEPDTLAEAKRNVEKLERLYAQAEAERLACLRMLGG